MITAAFIATVVAVVAFSWLFVCWAFPKPVEVGELHQNRLLNEVRGGRS